MKKVFRTIMVAGMAGAIISCGPKSEKTVVATTAAEEAVTVQVNTVESRNVSQENVYSTTILANVTNNIAPQSPGRIKVIRVEVGNFVSAGQIIAEMDRTNLEQAHLRIVNDSTELARQRALYEQGGLSKSDFDAIELAYNVSRTTYENLLENTILRSPINGVITARNYDKGDLYSGQTPIYTVQQISPVKMYVGISETEYTKVKKGDRVSLTVDAIPGETFYGTINRVNPTLNPATHTFDAEIVVPNSNYRLRPGMYARVKVVYGNNYNPVVPDDAVLKMEGSGQRYVYLAKDGKAVLTLVTVGRHEGFEYEITEGLDDGDQLIVKGQLGVRNGDKIKVVE